MGNILLWLGLLALIVNISIYVQILIMRKKDAQERAEFMRYVENLMNDER